MNQTCHHLALLSILILTPLSACSSSSSDTGATEGGGGGGAASSASDGTASGQGDEGELTPGGGGMNTTGTATGTAGGVSCDGELPVVVRDFTTSNPDFEQGNNVDDRSIVGPELGADNKPVYAGNPKTPTTRGKESFDQWYRDAPGINQTLSITLGLKKAASGVFTYDNPAFFPIDGKGLGNEGNNHNFHFTTEVHTQFTYKGGEVFTFTGDDDLFGYINHKLVINLGGIHQAETATVELDKVASQVGLVVGKSYPLDLFGAERHVTESHYRIDTTIDCFTTPPPPR